MNIDTRLGVFEEVFKDTDRLLESTGNKLRHVKISALEATKEPVIIQLVSFANDDQVTARKQ